MNIEPIITALRGRVPVLEQRVFGAAQWAVLERDEAPQYPAAYVVPLSEDPGDQESAVGYYQTVTNRFGVIVCVDQHEDERGQEAARQIDALRTALFKALLGWQQEPKTDYSEIVYEGGALLYMDPERVFWQFEFSFETYINTDETYQGEELAGLPPLSGLDISVDAVEPSARKQQPDGRIEGKIKVSL